VLPVHPSESAGGSADALLQVNTEASIGNPERPARVYSGGEAKASQAG